MNNPTHYPIPLTPMEAQFRESMNRAVQITALEDRVKVLEGQVSKLADAVVHLGTAVTGSMQTLQKDIARIREIVEEKWPSN